MYTKIFVYAICEVSDCCVCFTESVVLAGSAPSRCQPMSAQEDGLPILVPSELAVPPVEGGGAHCETPGGFESQM